MHYLSFCAWLVSLSITSSRFIHVVTSDRISFFVKAEVCIPLCTYNTAWEKIFANHTSHKGLLSKTYKELKQLNSKKTNKLIKKWAQNLSTHFKRRPTNGQWIYEKNTRRIVREIQIATTLAYPFTPVSVAVIKIRKMSSGEDVESGF
jgi:hypothetical protein